MNIVITSTDEILKIVYNNLAKGEDTIEKNINRSCLSSVSIPYGGKSIYVLLRNGDSLTFSHNSICIVDSVNASDITSNQDLCDKLSALIKV